MGHFDLTGRKALVTGGAQNLGAAIAKALSQAGSAVVLGDVNADAGEATAAEFRAAGAQARFVHLDVTDEASWDAAMPQVISDLGGLDILVNNAGIEITSLLIRRRRTPSGADRHRRAHAPAQPGRRLQAALGIRRMHGPVPVMVLSQYVADAYAAALLSDSDGAVGYLLKDRIGRIADFSRALETVAAGGTVIDPEMVAHLLARNTGSPIASLTPREREVLALMAEGLANQVIALKLVVSDAAVAKHIGNIFVKLGLAPDNRHRRVRAVLTFLKQ